MVQGIRTTQITDSMALQALANMCPGTDGAVVHEARALYSQVFNDPAVFSNDCGDTSTSKYGKAIQNNNKLDDIKQTYQLYPNPTTGNITLAQSILDILPVNVEIYNALGAKVEAMPIVFTGYTYKITLGKLPAGLYLMHLINSNGRSFNLRFTVQ